MKQKINSLEIEKLVNNGFSQSEICKITGLKKSNVSKRLKRLDLNYKTKKEKKATEKAEILEDQKETTKTIVDQKEVTTEPLEFDKKQKQIETIKEIDYFIEVLKKDYFKCKDIKIFKEINSLIANKNKILEKMENIKDEDDEPFKNPFEKIFK